MGGGARRDYRSGARRCEVQLAGLTLDAGALIAAERNDRRFWALWSEALSREVVPVVPAPALAQVWRGAVQQRLAQVVNACHVEPLDEALAKAAGELCGKAGFSDVVDAAVVASAARRGDAVATSDPADFEQLASHEPAVRIVVLR